MLKLTDSELDIVLAAARPLAVEDRDSFLWEVAARLADLPERGDGLVRRVAYNVARVITWDTESASLELSASRQHRTAQQHH
jgi:hypothetical protein